MAFCARSRHYDACHVFRRSTSLLVARRCGQGRSGDGRLPRRRMGAPRLGRRSAIRKACARGIPGRPVVVDHPAQARGVRSSLRQLRSRARPNLRPGRSGATDGRRRHRSEWAKIEATIGNAAAFLALAAERGSFASYLTAQLPRPAPIVAPDATPSGIPATTAESDALSADLRRRGFRFVGSTIVYAFMQSVGLVDDHLPGCHRYRG